MECFRLTARLQTPIIIGGGYLTLDALLGCIIFEEVQDVDEAHAQIPLVCTDGLYHASAAIVEPISQQGVTFVANMRADHALDPGLIEKNKHGRIPRRLGRTRRRDFGAVLNRYTSIEAEEIYWYGEGKPVAVESLVRGIEFIGKRRGSGYGQVSKWSLENADYNGLTGPFGEPLRPIPEDLFGGDKGQIKLDAAWRPPYWHPENRAVCYAPVPIS
jgi:hypothetical protein